MLSMLALVFSQANGIILLPLVMLQVIFSDSAAKFKWSWILCTVAILILFIFTYTYYIPFDGINQDAVLNKVIQAVPHIIVGFLALLGAAPFMESDPVILGVALGVVTLAVLCWMLLWMWKNNRSQFYPVAAFVIYSLISLWVCSTARVPFNGVTAVAYESRYKMYSVALLSLTLIFFCQRPRNNLWRFLWVGIAFLFFIYSYLRFSPRIVADSASRRQEVTEWTLTGAHDSLGESGWVSLSEQILFMSMNNGYYSPFDSFRGALGQHATPIPVASCDEWEGIAEVANISVRGKKGAAAMEIAFPGAGSIVKLVLCGNEKNYSLAPVTNESKFLLLNRSQFEPGSYVGYWIERTGKIYRLSNNIDIPREVPGMRCEGNSNPVTIRVRAQIAKDLCPKKSQKLIF
jgi:uncharacterized membrane protein